MPLPTISCNVVDRRSGLPAVGVPVLLRCLNPHLPNSEFQGKTDAQGYVYEWSGCSVPEITLLHFLFSNNCLATTTWQMGFLTTEYFDPVKPRYTCADINFVLSQGHQAPHITVFADINGYGTWIEPLKEYMQRPIARPRREYQKLSKDQNKALKAHFVDEPYPNPNTYRRLSEDLNLSPQQTMQWFRRQRAQGRRERKQQKRSMFQHESTLEAEWPGTDTVSAGALNASAAVIEPTEVETVHARAPEPGAAVMEPAEIEYPDVDTVGTIFIELGGKVLRRSGRQAKKAAK